MLFSDQLHGRIEASSMSSYAGSVAELDIDNPMASCRSVQCRIVHGCGGSVGSKLKFFLLSQSANRAPPFLPPVSELSLRCFPEVLFTGTVDVSPCLP